MGSHKDAELMELHKKSRVFIKNLHLGINLLENLLLKKILAVSLAH